MASSCKRPLYCKACFDDVDESNRLGDIHFMCLPCDRALKLEGSDVRSQLRKDLKHHKDKPTPASEKALHKHLAKKKEWTEVCTECSIGYFLLGAIRAGMFGARLAPCRQKPM